jgi:spermidine synthase
MPFLLYLVFAVSGAAGLIYESIWSRYLGLFVGHSAYAQIIVLVIFLGGMSAGAMAVGRRSERVAEPLLWYAAVEFATGAIGMVFHDVFVSTTAFAYDHLFPAMPGALAVTVVKWTLASLLILPQSVLLGTTFPLMSAGLLRRAPAGTGRVLALLYFTNSFGAAAGVLLAGFVLIGLNGLPGTLLTAAMLNVTVALTVYVAVRVQARWGRHRVAMPRGPMSATAAGAGAAPAERPPGVSSGGTRLGALWQLLLLVSFGTAIASFIYEIAWIRMLSLVLGSATHSFELMLSAFILGLSLGAFWVRTRADRFAEPLRALGRVQWAMGTLAIVTLPLYLSSFQWTAWLLAALDTTDQGYRLFTVARYGICLAVMLPATFCAGMTLPLITRTLLAAGAGERAIGMVYGVNTFGSILGAALAGLVLLPWLGLKWLLVAGAAVDLSLGIWLLARALRDRLEAGVPATTLAAGGGTGGAGTGGGRSWLPGAVAGAVSVAAIVLVVSRTGLDSWLLASGVYRFGRLPDPSALRVLFYRDGRTASVSARVNLGPDDITIATNGKPDASLGRNWLRPLPRVREGDERPFTGDQQTQVLLPLITLAHAPHARTGAVIGQGSGMTSHILLGNPRLEHLVTIDIEPEMIRGSRVFYPANRRVFDDPRSEFAIDDAKSYFAAGRKTYDLILSEPSNPWVSGVSGLFTTEFYHRVRTYLTPDGVFGQWLHLYEIDDGLVLSVVAAVHENFRSYQIFQVANTDMLIVASNQASLPAPDWTVAQFPGIQEDLAHGMPVNPEDLEATRIAGREMLAPLLDRLTSGADSGGANSDFYPALDLGTERTRYLMTVATGFSNLTGDRFDVEAALAGRRRDFGTERQVPMPDIPRQAALALGYRLRHGVRDSDPGGTRGAYFRLESFDRGLDDGRAPPDWRRWMLEAVSAERDLHGGTAGVADPAFYARLERYLRATRAPAQVDTAVRFMRALATWDFGAASRLGEPLVRAAARGEHWLPPDELRDGVVVARLRTGDVLGARIAFDRLVPVVQRSPADLRTRMLESQIEAAERAVTTASGGRPAGR